MRTLDALLAQTPVDHPRYFGKTRDEVSQLFDAQRQELKHVTMLALLAATEAALRVDYIVRVMRKKRDAISKDFTKLYKRRKLDVRLDEHILDAWKRHSEQPATKSAIGEFKSALNLRHWLAHGRYWKPRLGREYDPQIVFDICDGIWRAVAVAAVTK